MRAPKWRTSCNSTFAKERFLPRPVGAREKMGEPRRFVQRGAMGQDGREKFSEQDGAADGVAHEFIISAHRSFLESNCQRHRECYLYCVSR